MVEGCSRDILEEDVWVLRETQGRVIRIKAYGISSDGVRYKSHQWPFCGYRSHWDEPDYPVPFCDTCAVRLGLIW